MNNQGWSLNSLLAGLGVLTFALVFSVVLYDAKIKDLGEKMSSEPAQTQNKYTYADMEKDLIHASRAYLKEEYGKHIPEGSMRITTDTLEKEGFYKSTNHKDRENQKCTGHVTIEVKENHIYYHPYLKCGKYYETKRK